MHSRREVGKFSSVAIGMTSETIATYMALRAGMIGQHIGIRLLRSLISMFKSSRLDQSTTYKNVSEEFFFVSVKMCMKY